MEISKMKLFIGSTAAMLVLFGMATAHAAHETGFGETALVNRQYGYAMFEQTSTKGEIANSIQINGLAAYAIYIGMKEVKEETAVPGDVKTKSGSDITCTITVFNQASCVLTFANLGKGKFTSQEN